MTIMWRWATGKLTTTHNSVPVEIFRFLRTSFLPARWMRQAYRAGVSFFSRTKFQPCILRKCRGQSHESRARVLSLSDRSFKSPWRRLRQVPENWTLFLQSKDQFRGNTGPDWGRNTESPETRLRASRRAFRTEWSHKDQGKRTLDS